MELWDTEAGLKEILGSGMEARGRKEMGKSRRLYSSADRDLGEGTRVVHKIRRKRCMQLDHFVARSRTPTKTARYD
jgi:hypothetical protein